MEKFELSIWKDECQNRADFSTLLSGRSAAEGIQLLSKRDDVERVNVKEELLDNNEYLIYDDNELEINWHWQIAYYTGKQLKGFINQFEKANNYTINSQNYCTELKAYLSKTGREATGRRLFPNLYKTPIGKINTDNRFNYYFINEQGLPCGTDALDDGEIWRIKNHNNEEKILILANENMDLFQGRIYNIHFIPNISGEKKITFEVPKYYKDLLAGEKIDNEYLDYLHLKTKIKLHYRDKWYTFLINSKDEKKSRKGIYYSFEANDLAKEELSKNGYSLNFTEDPETIELCGAGTAAELTERVLANSGWKYSKELTNANMQEYEEKTVYSPIEGKYINKRVPVVSYKKHYSPFLKQYVFETDMFAKKQNNNTFSSEKEFSNYINFINSNEFSIVKDSGWKVYCYDKNETITTGSTPNLLASNSNFVSLDDWDTVNDNFGYNIVKVNSDYCLQLAKGGKTSTKNFVKGLSKGKYLIKIDTPNNTTSQYNIQIKNNSKELVPKSGNLNSGVYYVFNLNSSLGSNGEFIISSTNGIIIKSITLISLEVQDNTTGDNVVINYNQHKGVINSVITNKPQRFYEDKLINFKLQLILPDTIVSANSKVTRTYFIEPYSSVQEAREILNDETIEDTEEWIIELPQDKIQQYIQSIVNNNYKNYKKKTLKTENLSVNNITDNATNNNTIFSLTDKYGNSTTYVSKKFAYGDNESFEWVDLSLKPTSEKTRLISGSRSNRYSLLQDIAEKFKVYIGFEILHNPETGKIIYQNGQPVKYVYYTDRLGKQLYNGIIDVVNLDSITRKINSSELVTKMYVDNIETEYNDDGYVTIQLANKNPSKENYIYNFKHYLNINQLDNTFLDNLNNHNASLKAINEKYLKLTEDFTRIKEELSKQKTYLYTLEESKVAAENKQQELLEEICYIFEGTYNCITKQGYINSTKFEPRYNLDKKLIGKNTQNKQLNYSFRLLEIQTIRINNKDTNCVLVGDYDWVDKDSSNYIYHLNKETKITNKILFKEILDYLNDKAKKGYVAPSSFYYNDKTEQIYYYYNYDPKKTSSLRIKYVKNYFYIKESDFKTEFSNTKNWKFLNYNMMTFAPKFLAAATAKEKIGAYNLILEEIETHKKQIEEAKKEKTNIEKEYKRINKEVANLLKAKNSIVTAFENKYIQFIKEGTWSANNYSDNDAYYLDALCVSNDSCLPKVEYSISIVDISSIKGYESFYFEVGDETFVIDKDLFGCNSSGKPNEEKIIITEIDYQLDQNSNNKISLRNYTSRFEDLFTKITASVTAVQSNSEQWDKASVLNADGTIPSNLLTTINTNNSSLVNSSIGLLNTYSLDEKGLLLISQTDTNYQMKATSVGIFFTETANKNTQWTLGLSARGINANAINSGTINTNKISLMSEYSPSQIWDSLGLTMYSAAGIDKNISIEEDSFVRLDKHGLYFIDGKSEFGLQSDGVPWFYGRSFEDSLNEIKNKAKLSISRDGFIYNSNPDSKGAIKIGKIENKEGIKFTDKDGNICFQVLNDGTAQLTNFHFNKNKIWYGDGITSLTKAKQTKGSFFIMPKETNSQNAGLAMYNIVLNATTGMATFGDIKLTGGEITTDEKNTPVKIKKAMLGPFRFDSTGSKNKYMYGKASGTKIIEDWAKLDMTNKTVSQIVKTDHDFYLGTATITKKDLSNTMSSFSKEAQQKLSKDTAGVLLSLGNDFWIHSAGFGVISGDILLDGRVHIKQLDVEKLSVSGTDFNSLLQKNVKTTLTTLSKGVGDGTPFGYNDGKRQLFTQTFDLNQKISYVGYLNGKNKNEINFYNCPALKFSTNDSKPAYIVMREQKIGKTSFTQLYVVTYVINNYYYNELNIT